MLSYYSMKEYLSKEDVTARIDHRSKKNMKRGEGYPTIKGEIKLKGR